MKKISAWILVVAVAMGAVLSSMAAEAKKNKPKNRRAVELILEEIGGDHNPEKMKVTEVGSVETDTSWFHIYSGYLRKEYEYRIIIFDNTPRYLGYYQTKYRPENVEQDAIILFDETSGRRLKCPLKDPGPLRAVIFNETGDTANFVKGPEPEKPEATTDNAGDAAQTDTSLPGEEQDQGAATEEQKPEEKKPEAKKAEYRSWTIRRNGETIRFSAVFVEMKDRKTIVVKSSKNGNTADILLTELSPADRQYLQDLLQ